MNYDQIPDHPVIRGLVLELANRYESALKESNSIATGNILNFTFDIHISNNDFEIEFNLPAEWKYIEYGRRPGKQPPARAIEQWIKVKPIIPRAINGKVPTTKQTAFVIARSIGLKGIRGKYLLGKTLNKSDDIISRLKQEITNLVIQQMIDKINNKK